MAIELPDNLPKGKTRVRGSVWQRAGYEPVARWIIQDWRRSLSRARAVRQRSPRESLPRRAIWRGLLPDIHSIIIHALSRPGNVQHAHLLTRIEDSTRGHPLQTDHADLVESSILVRRWACCTF